MVDLAAVRRFYFEHHINKRVRDKDGPERAFRYLLNYLASVDVEPKVAAFTLARQVGFMKWLATQKLSNKTISTYLSYIKAGLRFCARPHLIKDMRKGEREVQILVNPPHIDDSEERVAFETKLPVSQPRDWTPSKAELAAMLDATADAPELEAMFRYMIMGLNTWARPEAITELSVLKQVDFPAGIITLNPPGRVQNKKRRPRIRLSNNLRAWLLY